MIKGIGTDIVDIERVRKAMSESFLSKVLSEEEIEKASSMKEERKVQFVAGRFAAKEAIIKALSDEEVPVMNELNIVNDDKGKPQIEYKDYQILISISHEKTYAVAFAILEQLER